MTNHAIAGCSVFFQQVWFDYDAIAAFIFYLFDFHNIKFYLVLDRTTWKWGKVTLNILTLAVAYEGVAIPIYWLILRNKGGNSNQRERIALMKRFIERFGSTQILGVLGDREFIGGLWWQWLSDKSIPYLIRVKENQQVMDSQGVSQPLSKLFANLKIGQLRLLKNRRCISGGQWVYLSALRLDDGELLILAANQKIKQPMTVYQNRWQIENLFQTLKGRGFHLEETRLTKYFRIKKVMALCAIAFCWAYKTGQWRHQLKPLKIKKHGELEKSLFRYGLDFLRDCLLQSSASVLVKMRLLILFVLPPKQIFATMENPLNLVIK